MLGFPKRRGPGASITRCRVGAELVKAFRVPTEPKLF
jgi:hypothetical protein